MPKKISTALQEFLLQPTLADGVTYTDAMGRADLITITLSSGSVLNMVYGTNQDIQYNGTTFYSSQLGSWERGTFTNSAQYRPEPKSMTLTALFQDNPGEPSLIQYFPGTETTMMSAINLGVFNGALVNIQTLFWPIDGTPADGIAMFTQSSPPLPPTMTLNVGQIGNVQKTGRSKVTFEVFDLDYLLNRPAPPHNIQSQCRHVLFDTGCAILQANWQSTAVTLDNTSSTLYLNSTLNSWEPDTTYAFGNMIAYSNGTYPVPYMCTTAGTSGGSAPAFVDTRSVKTQDNGTLVWTCMDSAYQLGFIIFASGQNTGFQGSVKLWTTTSGGAQQFQLNKPMPFPVSGGDTIYLVPGCDKSIATCTNGFNNIIHFGGMPFTPNPEIAV